MEAVRRQAILTFSRKNHLDFEENFKILASAMSKLTKDEVGLDEKLAKDARSAPVTYVDILQHEDFTISMFVLRHKSRVPLHDHPLMHGIIKLVSGVVEVESYSYVQDPVDTIRLRTLSVKREPLKTVSENDPPVILTPAKGNVHEITCVCRNGAAFIDVLGPPYGTCMLSSARPRLCHYYFKSHFQPPDSDTVRFTKIHNHPEFWTDDAPYLGR